MTYLEVLYWWWIEIDHVVVRQFEKERYLVHQFSIQTINNLVAENYFTLGKASPKVISLKFPMSSLSFVQNMHVCFEEAKQNINGSYCLWHYYTVKWFAFNVHIFPIEHNDLKQYGTQSVTILWLLLFTWYDPFFVTLTHKNRQHPIKSIFCKVVKLDNFMHFEMYTILLEATDPIKYLKISISKFQPNVALIEKTCSEKQLF